MGYFAVIDTETNWIDQVMSVGVVIADEDTMQLCDSCYYVLQPESQIGGMYEQVLFPSKLKPAVCARQEALQQIDLWLKGYGVNRLFAYNAGFDRNHLPELSGYCWYDIMRLAAYRQHNPKIPEYADCFSTGRLKRGYGVEAMLRLLSGNYGYRETHNALYDAVDELKLMQLLRHKTEDYIPLP